jgi:ABC-type phosphate/phosphonate transport system substrate-binding protein
MIASLPMYLTPQTAAAYARFWAAIRDNIRSSGVNAPDSLAEDMPDLLAHWCDPDLLLSQTCGLPYRAVLKDQVTLVGTPDYGLSGCPPGHYNSVVITRADLAIDSVTDLTGRTFAYNDPLSQSGWAALALTRPEVLTGTRRLTGSHRASVRAVKDGDADFATIDAQTWRQLEALGETDSLSVIARTEPVAGLPLVTCQPELVPQLQEAVRAAIAALSDIDRNTISIRDLVVLPADAYDLPIPPAPEAITG